MNSRSFSTFLFLIVLAAITIWYMVGVPAVPFHPDESTQLFTSGDVNIFLNRASDLYWRPDNENDPRQRYRELDAPLNHTILALGRWLAGQPALPVDWDWAKTWQENEQAGALPTPELLLAGRIAVAALFPFSVFFLFLAVRRAANDFAAWVAALLLATNALVFLHTRRAMAEGALLFTLTLSMWTLVKAEKRPWLIAVPVALAFCAKQSLVALVPAGLLAVLWLPGVQNIAFGKKKITQQFGQAALYAITFIAIVFLLNPFLWSQPFPAAQAALHARQALASAQTADRPDQALDTPGRKLVGLIGSVYITPPIFAETGNYLAETSAAETAYLSNPLNALFRSIPAGGLLLIAGLFGFALGFRRLVQPAAGDRRRPGLLLAAALIQTLALLVLIPLPWQRYYLPVVPYACLYAALGIDQFRTLLGDIIKRVRVSISGKT
jgi:hypothetical protein